MTTIVFLAILVGIVIVLIIAKIIIVINTKTPQKTQELVDEISIGNVQSICNADFQTNYFATISKNNAVLSVVADGLNDNESGRLASVIAVETLKQNFNQSLNKAFSIKDFFKESFIEMQKTFSKNINLNKFGVKLAAVIIDGGFLDYAIVGDCKIFVYRHKSKTLIDLLAAIESKNTNNCNNIIGTIKLMSKDIVMLASRAACENLTEMEIAWYLELDNHPQEKCQMLLKRAQKKHVQQGNTTIIVLENLPAAAQTPQTHKTLLRE